MGNERRTPHSIAVFGNPRAMCLAALLAAMSLILGKFLQIPTPFSQIIRISFENLPLLLDIPIVPAEQVDAEIPLGSGPYWLDISGKHALLRRRENWWCKATVAATATAIGLLEATKVPRPTTA